ncbi:MAG: manganese transporter, partial [Candidatus Viridilinea halotolerans]
MSRMSLPLLLLLALVLSACGPTAPSAEDEVATRLKVVATTQQLADAVANVAQDRVALTALFGPGSDPHSYLPTEGDINIFQQADLIFYNGLLLEAQLVRVLEQTGERSATRVVAVAEQLDPQRLMP